MSLPSEFSIDLDEEFPTLTQAPIVEAMIFWQAPPANPFDFQELRNTLTKRVPEYPVRQPQQNVEVSATFHLDGSSQIGQSTQNGLRVKDKHQHVAQIMQNGVVFSRLAPYDQWQSFKGEALKFWAVFTELAQPKIIHQVGVRYINRVSIKEGETPATYLKSIPREQEELGLIKESFFYQDIYLVPGTPYQVKWVSISQPSSSSSDKGLLIDISVMTTQPTLVDQSILGKKLDEMRWVKNKIFLSSISNTALHRFQGEK